ncbi:hypothetical protein ACFVAJ_09975 [Agromyces sp. NPDC057679]|uniref:hypothetical protein n=1 Tax=Agromyces sp. NPDC057679 TaxID=3346207 RepID=UPI00366E05FF
MTLTRLLPTLRRSIPDPIAPERWPAGTRVTTTDVIVGGFSMTRLAERDGTPLAHLAPTPARTRTGGLDGPVRHRGVAVATVREVAVAAGVPLVSIDGENSPLRPDWAEARLIGRVSVAKVVTVSVRFAAGGCHALAQLELPADLTAGDLIAVPVEADRVTISVAGPLGPARLAEPALHG